MVCVKHTNDLFDSEFDCVIAINDSICSFSNELQSISKALQDFKHIHSNLDSTLTLVPFNEHPSKKLIYSPIESLNEDFVDSRVIYEASSNGMKMAISLDLRKPLLVFGDLTTLPTEKWTSRKYIELNIILGALFAAYVPIEIRVDVPSRSKKIDILGVYYANERSIFIASGLEEGRRITRDIAGSDPERMSAQNIVTYIEQEFEGTDIQISIESVDKAKYPLMDAVNRGASQISRHDGRVVKFVYDSHDDVEESIFLVGKGIIYDSGGADVKINGNMIGMHRDKSGAAAITGLFKALSILKPKKIKFFGFCAFVRNSIGEDCYVSDEIITSRAKKRVRVGNTDAEGRMVMADLLCEAKELALNAINPSLFTIATLTGHVRRAYGLTYTAIMGNGMSYDKRIPKLFQEAGNLISEPFEISTIRREDMEFHRGYYEYEDVLQCNTKPSVDTPRGHQTPAAFLILASGLDKHSKISCQPLPYTHLDIAGSGGKIGAIPTAVPLLSFASMYILPRLA